MKPTTVLLLAPFLGALAAPANSGRDVAVAQHDAKVFKRESPDGTFTYRSLAEDDAKVYKREAPDGTFTYRSLAEDDAKVYKRESPDGTFTY